MLSPTAPSVEALRKRYDAVFSGDPSAFFTRDNKAIHQEILGLLDWQGKHVCEIGCGDGGLAVALATRGAIVDALDSSRAAITKARQRPTPDNTYVRFYDSDFDVLDAFYDVVIASEVIEHTEQPDEFLERLARATKLGGHVVISCPSFNNARGYIWAALALLLDIPMSLTDRHFLSIFEVLDVALKHDLEVVKCTTIHHEQGHGSDLLTDYRRRLPNALRDAGFFEAAPKVPAFLDFLAELLLHENSTWSNGATAVYLFQRICDV